MIHQSSHGFPLMFRPHDLRPEIYKKYIWYYNSDFHSDGLLDTDVREVTSIQKKDKSMWQGNLAIEVTGSMYFGNIFRIMHATFPKSVNF